MTVGPGGTATVHAASDSIASSAATGEDGRRIARLRDKAGESRGTVSGGLHVGGVMISWACVRIRNDFALSEPCPRRCRGSHAAPT